MCIKLPWSIESGQWAHPAVQSEGSMQRQNRCSPYWSSASRCQGSGFKDCVSLSCTAADLLLVGKLSCFEHAVYWVACFTFKWMFVWWRPCQNVAFFCSWKLDVQRLDCHAASLANVSNITADQFPKHPAVCFFFYPSGSKWFPQTGRLSIKWNINMDKGQIDLKNDHETKNVMLKHIL